MTADEFMAIQVKVIEAGYGFEVAWAESIEPCKDTETFLREYIWVVIHGGTAHKVARTIEGKVWDVIAMVRARQGTYYPIEAIYMHRGKVKAIKYMLGHAEECFRAYVEAEDKLEYLHTLPYIGAITRYHLAKNLGLDVVKPDRHLFRIADRYGKLPQEFCKDIATARHLQLIVAVTKRVPKLYNASTRVWCGGLNICKILKQLLHGTRYSLLLGGWAFC